MPVPATGLFLKNEWQQCYERKGNNGTGILRSTLFVWHAFFGKEDIKTMEGPGSFRRASFIYRIWIFYNPIHIHKGLPSGSLFCVQTPTPD